MSFSSKRIAAYDHFKNEPLPEFKNDSESDFPLVNILEHIVLKKPSDKKELEYQTFFSEKVLKGETQHFPLVYRSEEDVFSMEKFDGNFLESTNYCYSKDKSNIISSEEELISGYVQVMMALQFVDSYGKFHGDLNHCNVLFKKIDDGSEYINYVINGETYRVKHFNRLWVLADFEMSGEKGVDLSIHNSVYDKKFFNRMFGSDHNLKSIKGSWLYDMYIFTRSTGAAGMMGRLFELIKDDSKLSPIEAMTIVIKNDLTNILLRE